MSRNPLAEVFGYPVDNFSPVAVRHRAGKLCPFHNSASLHCTKNSATDPLGVCTVVAGDGLAITCPTRLRQDLLIVEDAARFFFPQQTRYISLPPTHVPTSIRKAVSSTDIVLAVIDEEKAMRDFGLLIIPKLYTSGNLGKSLAAYIQDPNATHHNIKSLNRGYPRPDYSSSCRQLILNIRNRTCFTHQQGKKIAIALQRPFFERLPKLPAIDETEADLAWFIYDLSYNCLYEQYKLERVGVQYTKYKDVAKHWQYIKL